MAAAAQPLAGAPRRSPSLRAARRRSRRGRDQGRSCSCAALVSVLTTIGIVDLAAAGDDRLLRRRPVGDFLFGTKWTPLFARRPAVLRRAARWSAGTLYLTAHRASSWPIPLGLLRRDLPRRVRAAARAQDRSSRSSSCWPACRRSSSATSRSPSSRRRSCATSSASSVDHLQRARRPGIIIGLLVLPTIASVAEDAMRRCPQSLREGAFGLGASKLQVSLRVVFPAALSGIVAALVLGASRAVGETMIVLHRRRPASPNLGRRPARVATSRWPRSSRATARGDIPTGLDRVQDDLRRRHARCS